MALKCSSYMQNKFTIQLQYWWTTVSTFFTRDLWIWGMTPPPAIVALIRKSSSSSPLIANCRCLGDILFCLKSFEAFPASSKTSAVRYSKIAAVYTAAVPPTRLWVKAWFFKWRWILKKLYYIYIFQKVLIFYIPIILRVNYSSIN